MDELTIFWTLTAKKQRNQIFNYWNKRNKSKIYSRKLNIAIHKRTNSLKSHPGTGKPTDINEIRAISMGHYNILYKIIQLKVIIMGFWDNRQDPEKLLKFLKRN